MLGCSHGFELYGVIIIRDNVGVGFIPITVKNIITPPCKIQESNNVFDIVSSSLSNLNRNDSAHNWMF